MRKISYTLLATLFLFACGKAPEPKPTTPLIITTSANGEVRFNVETAQTPEELQTGLMHRTFASIYSVLPSWPSLSLPC